MSRQLRNSTLIFAVALASATAAYVIADEAAGTIRSVDAKSRTVVLRVDQQKTLDLTVSRKARVLVDGKESAIEAIRSGQKATVIYSADTDVATEVRAITDANPEAEAAADMKWLQGEWVSIGERVFGKELTKAELKEMNKRVSIKGNRFIMKRVDQGKAGTYDGRFEFVSSITPKQFNWTGKGPWGNAVDFEGIYEVDKDLEQFKVFFVVTNNANDKKKDTQPNPRPDSFDGKVGFYVTFKRDKE